MPEVGKTATGRLDLCDHLGVQRRPFSPPQLLALHIFALIAVGGVLLALPVAGASGHPISLINAFFTSTSAVCVTGLIVLDTPKDLSLFGHIVLMLLIQLGGLGYMTISTLVAVALGRRITLQERLTLQEALNIYTREGLLRFAGTVLVMTLAFELAGAFLLALRWTPEFGVTHGAFLGLFHAVSAFNNAGFALFSDSLTGYRGDVLVNLVMTTLIICGGLGFLVLSELARSGRHVPLSLHTRLVLVLTALLIVGATIGIYTFERGNPGTLGGLPAGEAWLAAYFQSVTPRTAGFNTINIGAMYAPTLFLTLLLMFIGASPGGTGGGVKTTTFSITVAALWAMVRGRQDVVIFKRRLPPELVARAFFVSLIAFLALNLVAALVLIAERRDFLASLFETTSAFGTVGLSMGRPGSSLSLASAFSEVGKLLIMLMMFMGRVGPLTLAVAVAGRVSQPRIRYPEGKVLIG
jgi:trk system potassium uptake protein TrkH